MTRIVRIGNVELTEAEAYRMYAEGKYLVTYSKIYQVFYSVAQRRFYGIELYHHNGMARRDRFYAMSGKDVNRLVGSHLVNE
jgi:hypothetical protein